MYFYLSVWGYVHVSAGAYQEVLDPAEAGVIDDCKPFNMSAKIGSSARTAHGLNYRAICPDQTYLTIKQLYTGAWGHSSVVSHRISIWDLPRLQKYPQPTIPTEYTFLNTHKKIQEGHCMKFSKNGNSFKFFIKVNFLA